MTGFGRINVRKCPLCCFLDLLWMLEELILTKESTPIIELIDWFGGDSRKLMVQIGLVEMNEFYAILMQVLCNPMDFGFVLSRQQDDMRMIWQFA